MRIFDKDTRQLRDATQDDLDQLQRIEIAFGHVITGLRALPNEIVREAQRIIADEPVPSMSDHEKTMIMHVEDYRQELELEYEESGTYGTLPDTIRKHIFDKRFAESRLIEPDNEWNK